MFDKVLFAVSGALALALFLWRRAALQKLAFQLEENDRNGLVHAGHPRKK